MAPKAKAARAGALPIAAITIPDVNSDYFAELGKATQNVISNQFFKSIREDEPSPHPFDMDAFKKSIKATGTYTCRGNVAWLQESYNTLNGVPFSLRNVKALSMRLDTPHFFDNFKISVAVGDDPLWLPTDHKGSLKPICPLEPLHALWFAVDRDLKQGKDASVLKAWRGVFLSAMILESR